MEEKIKIHLSKDVYDVLIKDCEAFEFYKTNGQINKNAFLTKLINNYYKSYQEKENILITLIEKELKEELSDYKELTLKIVNKLNKLSSSPNKEKFSSLISLKPTKETQMALSYIEKYLLNQTGISEFFRNMFTSYASLPQDQREKIIFKTQYETLIKAIKENKKVFFTTKAGRGQTHESSPFSLTTSKEELHCYLLTKYKEQCKTYRLNRIEEVTIINEEREFNQSDIEQFNKMIEHGPQFTYEDNEEIIIVKLNERGKALYKAHYVHRPNVDFIEGDYYYFSCSHSHIKTYFRRFGKNAYIVSPYSLQKDFIKFYKQAHESYIENGRLKKGEK